LCCTSSTVIGHCCVSRVMLDNQYIWSLPGNPSCLRISWFCSYIGNPSSIGLKKNYPSCTPAPSSNQIRTFEITLGLCAIRWREIHKGALSLQHMINTWLVNNIEGGDGLVTLISDKGSEMALRKSRMSSPGKPYVADRSAVFLRAEMHLSSRGFEYVRVSSSSLEEFILIVLLYSPKIQMGI